MAPPIKGDLRIVLLGMTGAGKSATGNTILGRDEFQVDFNPESVTQKSEKKETRKGRRNISIIDTPGLQDSKGKENEVKAEIKKCMRMSAPGPHVFLLVIRLDERYTEEKMNTVNWIQKNFGEEAARHTIILLTHADSLSNRPLQDHIEDSRDLRRLIISCGGRYHAFNNEDRKNQDQVNELLLKIDKMVLKNEGKHYTNEMYRQAQARLSSEDCWEARQAQARLSSGDCWEARQAQAKLEECSAVIAFVVAIVIVLSAAAAAEAQVKEVIKVLVGVVLVLVVAGVVGVIVGRVVCKIIQTVQTVAVAIKNKL